MRGLKVNSRKRGRNISKTESHSRSLTKLVSRQLKEVKHKGIRHSRVTVYDKTLVTRLRRMK